MLGGDLKKALIVNLAVHSANRFNDDDSFLVRYCSFFVLLYFHGFSKIILVKTKLRNRLCVPNLDTTG